MIRFRICPIPSSSGKERSAAPLPPLLPRLLVSGVFACDVESDLSAGDVIASRREREELLNDEVVDLSLSGNPCNGRLEGPSATFKVYWIGLPEGSRLSVAGNRSVVEFGPSSCGQAYWSLSSTVVGEPTSG